jgi:hypothetical protein
MSHQVQLSTLKFTNLEMIKEAVRKEGLEIMDYMQPYGSWGKNWNKGDAYGTNGQKMEFGIKIPTGQVKCGFALNTDGSYSFVGDGDGLKYNGTYGLSELSARLNQRFLIEKGVSAANANGFFVTSMPEELERYGSKNYISLRGQRQQILQTTSL